MRRNLLCFKKRILNLWMKKSVNDKKINEIYKQKNYLDAYSEHTNLRVENDPHSAVGGKWEKLGKLQFNFLVNNGLKPHHRMLDIGCGTLRGGRHFIKYLEENNYTGIDISSKAIEYCLKLVEHERLTKKNPLLLVSLNKDLKFSEFKDEKFDYILAQSVFTHLKAKHIEECFKHINKIMKKNTIFFFTFNEEKKFIQTGHKDFKFPFSFFKVLADEHEFMLKDCSSEYGHPSGQNMVMLLPQK